MTKMKRSAWWGFPNIVANNKRIQNPFRVNGSTYGLLIWIAYHLTPSDVEISEER